MTTYWEAASRHHDIWQEWLWLDRLHRTKALVWKGAMGTRALSADSAGKRHWFEPGVP